MLFIIQKFEPQLKHYSRRLHSEDAQSELTLRFIETIHAMNLDSLRSQGDGTIVAYLAQSVRNAYISLLPFKKTVEPPVSWEELTEAQLLGLVAPIREREVLDFSELLDTCPELTKKERKVLNYGLKEACKRNPVLRSGVIMVNGKITQKEVADSQGVPYTPLDVDTML